MKKIFLIIALSLGCTISSFAQFMPDSTLINFTSRNGDLEITFGGQELIFGQIPDADIPRTKFILDFCNAYSFGWIFTPGADHSGMTTGMDYLDFRPMNSVHFEFEPLTFAIKFPSRNYIKFGLSLSADNYRFNDDITIKKVDNKIVAVPLSDVEKSKVKAVYIGFPVSFDLYLGRGFYISPVVEYSLLTKGQTKFKSPKTKDKFSGFNETQMNYGLRFTRDGSGFFVNYSPTPIFKEGVGEKANRLTFGIVFFM